MVLLSIKLSYSDAVSLSMLDIYGVVIGMHLAILSEVGIVLCQGF